MLENLPPHSYDRASPNLTAMRTLALIYVQAEQLPCVSHTLDHVGEHFDTPNLTPILLAWRGMVSTPGKAATVWERMVFSCFPMFLHQSERDAYVMQSIHGEFKNSAYLKTINSRTFDNNDHGLTWKLAELELLAVVEVAKMFVQGIYF